MLAVKVYYDGTKIIVNDDVVLQEGQELIITLLDTQLNIISQNQNFDFDKYTTKTDRIQDAGEYIKELRENDRI